MFDREAGGIFYFRISRSCTDLQYSHANINNFTVIPLNSLLGKHEGGYSCYFKRLIVFKVFISVLHLTLYDVE